MKAASLAVLLVLAGCAIAPEPDMPEGVVDPKIELVERIKDTPTDLDAHADLLRLQIRDGDREGAEATYFHVLKHNGMDYRAHLLAAQYHRWQLDLLSAETSLLTARDMAPEKLEPRVALGELYREAFLEKEELEQRRIASELAEPAYRDEFLLDLAYACERVHEDERAVGLATALANNTATRAELRSLAFTLNSKLRLRAANEPASVEAMIAAYNLAPNQDSLVRRAARMATVVKDRKTLTPLFDNVLETRDTAEARWAALFGKWTIAVLDALAQKKDPLKGAADDLYQRMDIVAPGHPNTSSRRFQLLALDPLMSIEMEQERKRLAESEFGVPPVPKSAGSLVQLWRAEDALIVGAPRAALAELEQLAANEPELDGLPMMQIHALFAARDYDRCTEAIKTLQSELDEPQQVLEGMQWMILLWQGQGKRVLTEVEAKGEPTNATIWFDAVAKFHVYRGAANAPREG
jgi:hypothetical protein